MLGFVKKDLFLLRSNVKTALFILIVYIGLAVMGNIDISIIIPMLSLILFLSTFSYDEYNNYLAYSSSLPGGRKNYVMGKYVAILFITILLSIITVILMFILSYTSNINIISSLENMCGVVLGLFIVIAVLFPLMFKYGAQKARMVLFVIFGALYATISIIEKIKLNIFKSSFLINYGLYIFIVISILSLIISYLISLKIYNKKEL